MIAISPVTGETVDQILDQAFDRLVDPLLPFLGTAGLIWITAVAGKSAFPKWFDSPQLDKFDFNDNGDFVFLNLLILVEGQRFFGKADDSTLKDSISRSLAGEGEGAAAEQFFNQCIRNLLADAEFCGLIVEGLDRNGFNARDAMTGECVNTASCNQSKYRNYC